jgi:hypothetical protein
MAHERQVESSNDTKEASKPLKTFSGIVADWLNVYAAAYREEVTEELTLAYLEALKDIRPILLHQAFLHALKRCKFRPTPAEVRESFEIVAQQAGGNRPKYLDEPPLSPEEREAAMRDFPLPRKASA